MATKRIPPNFFGFAFGVAGLSETWAIAAHDGRAPRAVATALASAAGLVWLVVIAYYLSQLVADRSVLKRDLLDPIAAPFLSLAVIGPMVWILVAIAPYFPSAGKALFDIFLILTVLLGGWFTGQWIYGPLELDKLHPGYFLPTVAGGLIASDGAALLGQRLLAEVMLGLGVVCWLILGSMILGRLLFRPALPPPLLPTLAIEIAPAAVASLAWFDSHGDRLDAVAAFLAGYGLLMIIAQLRLLPMFFRLPFMPSTWAFTFSWAAVASASLHWLDDAHRDGYIAYEYLVLGAISLLIGAIAARTVLAIVRRQLLPAGPPSIVVPAAVPPPIEQISEKS